MWVGGLAFALSAQLTELPRFNMDSSVGRFAL